jgi:2-furoyl-CoA dehydrogenase 2Fe-2S iron sulfur subunit
MSLSTLFAQATEPTEAEIRDVIGGHLCRCTGYAGILAAALEVAASLKC